MNKAYEMAVDALGLCIDSIQKEKKEASLIHSKKIKAA